MNTLENTTLENLNDGNVVEGAETVTGDTVTVAPPVEGDAAAGDGAAEGDTSTTTLPESAPTGVADAGNAAEATPTAQPSKRAQKRANAARTRKGADAPKGTAVVTVEQPAGDQPAGDNSEGDTPPAKSTAPDGKVWGFSLSAWPRGGKNPPLNLLLKHKTTGELVPFYMADAIYAVSALCVHSGKALYTQATGHAIGLAIGLRPDALSYNNAEWGHIIAPTFGGLGDNKRNTFTRFQTAHPKLGEVIMARGVTGFEGKPAAAYRVTFNSTACKLAAKKFNGGKLPAWLDAPNDYEIVGPLPRDFKA